MIAIVVVHFLLCTELGSNGAVPLYISHTHTHSIRAPFIQAGITHIKR